MLPVERPQQLREFASISRRDSPLKVVVHGGSTSFAYPVYAHVRDRSTVFDDVFLFDQRALDVGMSGREQRLPGLLVSGNFLRDLGVGMVIGRSIAPDDDRVEAPAVAVLTHGFWQRVFGGDSGALGQTLAVNGMPTVIIGVTARTFEGVEPGSPIDVIVPSPRFCPRTKPERRWETPDIGAIASWAG